MSDPRFFRNFLDVLNEGPPAGIGPNAPVKPASQAPLNVPQGWEAKTQPDGSTRISKQGSMSSADYKQSMADYKAKNWTPEKMADYSQRMASGQGYSDAERQANLQQQQQHFGKYADDTNEGKDTVSNPRFFRKYIDMIDEGPPPGVGPNAPVAPKAAPANQPLGGYDPKSGKAPTQQQADNLMGQIDAAGNQIVQGGEKMGAGNYVGGAMDAARGANDLLNAAGATTADKLKMGWTGVKAGANAGLAYLRGKGEEGALAAAAGTVGQELTQPMADYAKSKTFDKDFNQAMSAPTSNDSKMAQIQQDAQRNLITPNSMKNYMTGVNQTMGDLKSGDTTAYDRLEQQTMYRQDTMTPYLDISKKQAMTGQQVQTPGELMGQEEPPAGNQPVQEDELVRLKELLKR